MKHYKELNRIRNKLSDGVQPVARLLEHVNSM